MVMYTLKFDNQALMAILSFITDGRKYDGKYGITVFVWING